MEKMDKMANMERSHTIFLKSLFFWAGGCLESRRWSWRFHHDPGWVGFGLGQKGLKMVQKFGILSVGMEKMEKREKNLPIFPQISFLVTGGSLAPPGWSWRCHQAGGDSEVGIGSKRPKNGPQKFNILGKIEKKILQILKFGRLGGILGSGPNQTQSNSTMAQPNPTKPNQT